MGNVKNIAPKPERAFFVKCRPQGADIIEIVRSEKRVFIGYPPWRRDASYDPANISACVVDLGRADEGWKDQIDGYHSSMKTNRGFAASVERGWIVAIPRPGDGVCWLGEIDGDFELVNDPPWRSRYLDLRHQCGLDCSDEASHVGDIVQSWPLSRLVSIPFGRVPRWISYRLLSRPTIGEIYGFPEIGLHAHWTLKRFLDGVQEAPFTETSDLGEIQRRILTFVSPSGLEHLCVALLQLEYPNETWWHIGGSGDGGADGLGYTLNWEHSGLLQCKWYFPGSRLSDTFSPTTNRENHKRILASLIHGNVVKDLEDAEFWGREDLAILIRNHAPSLPTAKSLRIIGT